MRRICRRTISLLTVVALLSSLFSIFPKYYKPLHGFALSYEETIYNYLRNTMGFNTAAACAVLGNLHVESGGSFSPETYNNAYKVTLNANGGKVSPTSINVTYDSTYGTLSTATREGYTFNGWYNAKSGGTNLMQFSETGVLLMFVRMKGSIPLIFVCLNSCFLK